MAGLTRAELSVVVQADAVGELPPSITPITRPVSSGTRRAIEGLRTIHDAALIHGLDVDLPARRTSPRVTTIHDMSVFDTPWAFSRFRVAGERLLITRSIRSADAIIAVSRFTAERVEHHFGRSATVIPLAPASRSHVATGVGGRSIATAAVNTDRQSDDAVEDPATNPVESLDEVRRRYDLPRRFVLQLASIEPRKDPELLARACARLNIPLVLAGSLSDRSCVPPGALHLGYVDPNDLDPLLAAAEIVAYVSRYEGFGLPPIEAMANGRPVVASDVGGLADVVGNGAILVPVGDEDRLVDALRSLWADEEARRHLAQRGRAQATKLSWSATADATVDVYRQLGVEL